MGYHETFKEVLLAHSKHLSYDDAIQEWVDYGDHFTEEYSCICGHHITENCPIRNRLNGSMLIVGNCCIRKFRVEHRHLGRSKAAYFEYALLRVAFDSERRFVEHLKFKAESYPTLKMSEAEKKRLEGITGQPWRWKYQW